MVDISQTLVLWLGHHSIVR